jgi:transposase
MSRSDLERLSKEELIELVLKLHRPEKTSRTSSKPPASDRKERREKSRPGGAKPGHEGHTLNLQNQFDMVKLADYFLLSSHKYLILRDLSFI